MTVDEAEGHEFDRRDSHELNSYRNYAPSCNTLGSDKVLAMVKLLRKGRLVKLMWKVGAQGSSLPLSTISTTTWLALPGLLRISGTIFYH